MSYQEGLEKAKEYNLDGIMIGRGIFHNPWIFNTETREHEPREKIDLLKKHIQNFLNLWGKDKNFDVMKRFVKIYINGWPGAKELRDEIMKKRNAPDIMDILARWIEAHRP